MSKSIIILIQSLSDNRRGNFKTMWRNKQPIIPLKDDEISNYIIKIRLSTVEFKCMVTIVYAKQTFVYTPNLGRL
jgi:hypothetical protein